MRLKSFIGIIFLSTSFLSGCSWFASHNNPLTVAEVVTKKEDRTVYVAGTVLRTVPLFQNGAYQLQDDTGAVWILTNDPLPKTGDKISVKGKLKLQQLAFAKVERYLAETERQLKLPEAPK